MKIAYIIYPEVIITNRSNGVRSQAESWGSALQRENIKIDFVNNWGNYNWKDYDAIHIFGSGSWVISVAKRLSKLNDKIVYSPIIDPDPTLNVTICCIKRDLSKIVNGLLRNNTVETIKQYEHISRILVRSDFEANYIKKVFLQTKITYIPLMLSYDTEAYAEVCNKGNFCLHISSITQPRKNVLRLIKAAKKYKFNLVLAGNKGTPKEFNLLEKEIGDSANIEVMGFISEEEKIKLYKKAKVFALPSTSEGVGIVALDAAAYGCEIVITEIGGPKEYYDNYATTVNPYDIDDIGKAILNNLNGKTGHQPILKEFVIKNYSRDSVANNLVDFYKTLQNAQQ